MSKRSRRRGIGVPEGEPWMWRSLTLLRSAAWHNKSTPLTRLLDFLELRYVESAGQDNGYLIALYDELVACRISRRLISPAIAEGEARGLIIVDHGHAMANGKNCPSHFRLTYLPGRVLQLADPKLDKEITPPTDEWRRYVEPTQPKRKTAGRPKKIILTPNKVELGDVPKNDGQTAKNGLATDEKTEPNSHKPSSTFDENDALNKVELGENAKDEENSHKPSSTFGTNDMNKVELSSTSTGGAVERPAPDPEPTTSPHPSTDDMIEASDADRPRQTRRPAPKSEPPKKNRRRPEKNRLTQREQEYAAFEPSWATRKRLDEIYQGGCARALIEWRAATARGDPFKRGRRQDPYTSIRAFCETRIAELEAGAARRTSDNATMH